MYLRSSIVGIGGVVVLLLMAQGFWLMDASESATAVMMQIDSALVHIGGNHTSAMAEEPTYSDELFENYDINLDGQLTASELPAREYARLQSCDFDRSGSLSYVELQDVPPLQYDPNDPLDTGTVEVYDPNATLYQQLDIDGDGALTAGETPEILWASIEEADMNRDGKVTSRELAASAASRPEEP